MPEHIASAKPSWSRLHGPDQLKAALHNMAGEACQRLATAPSVATTVEQATRRDG